MANVIINDYVTSKRVKLIFLAEDYEIVNDRWESKPEILGNLQEHEFFEGCFRWCDLSSAHFRVLIANHLDSVSYLAEEDRVDDENPLVSSLNFLICALVRCIEIAADCHIEFLKLNRVGEHEVAVEFYAAMQMEIVPRRKRKKKKTDDPFAVVIDNTKE